MSLLPVLEVYPGGPFLVLLFLVWLGLMVWTRAEVQRYPVSVSLGTMTMFIVLGYLYTLSSDLKIAVMLAYLAVVALALSGVLGLAWLIAYVINLIRGGMTLKAHLAQLAPAALILVGLFILERL